MSAPATRDPLVVNTADGTCWVRRAMTRDGRGLYAVEGSCRCPAFVMATLAELAEHGLAGSADVLPMPVSPEPPVDADRAKAPWGRGEDGRPALPMGAHWTDIPELVGRTLSGIQARVDQAQPGSWYVPPATETWRAPGTVCTRYDGYNRTVGLFTNVRPADLEFVLHAHQDLRWCLEMIAKLRAATSEAKALRSRVAELEARPSRADVLRQFAGRVAEMRDEGDPEVWVPAAAHKAAGEVIEEAHRLAADTGPMCPVCQNPPCHCSCFGKAPAPHCSHGAKKLDKANLAQPEPAPELTVYRAEHDSIVMGLYTTAAAARAHCESYVRREIPGASLDWIEDEEDGVAELVAAFGEDERPTGYLVTALTVASAYDEEADE